MFLKDKLVIIDESPKCSKDEDPRPSEKLFGMPKLETKSAGSLPLDVKRSHSELNTKDQQKNAKSQPPPELDRTMPPRAGWVPAVSQRNSVMGALNDKDTSYDITNDSDENHDDITSASVGQNYSNNILVGNNDDGLFKPRGKKPRTLDKKDALYKAPSQENDDEIITIECVDGAPPEDKKQAAKSKQMKDVQKTMSSDGPQCKPCPVVDMNTYQQRKTMAQSMMDLALLTANANQLRYVLESETTHPYYAISIALISTSLVFQVLVGIALILNSRYNVNHQEEILTANHINNLTVMMIFLITIVNVFVTSFSVVTPISSTVLTSASGPGSYRLWGR